MQVRILPPELVLLLVSGCWPWVVRVERGSGVYRGVEADPAALTAAENVLRWVLAAGGYTVTLVDDAAPAPTGGIDLVIVAPTVDPAVLAGTYADSPIPLVSLAAGTWQASGLTSAAPTAASSDSAYVTDAGHPLAGGKSGTIALASTPDDVNGVAPAELGSGAVAVWARSDTSTDVVVAGYDDGAAMPAGPAPARRVTMGLSAGLVAGLTTDGWEVFAAVIEWAGGNTGELGTTNFDFDAFEQLARITTPDASVTDQAYDGLGRRVSSPTGTLTYAGTEIRPTTDGASRFQRGPVGVIGIDDTSDGGGLWAHTDAHSDVVGTFDPGDTALSDPQAFSPWGETLAGGDVALGYQSERRDLPGGLIAMGVREYDPAAGTFISHDPVVDPLVLNGYSYTSANPLGQTDPTGQWVAPVAVGAGGGTIIGGSCAAACWTGVGAVAVGVVVIGCVILCGGGGGDRSFTGLQQAAKDAQAKQNALDAAWGDAQREQQTSWAPPGGVIGAGAPGGGGGGGQGGTGPGHGSGTSTRTATGTSPARSPKVVWTDPAIIFSPPPPPVSPLAALLKSTGSAIENYPGRFQTDSTGERFDTGIASKPTATVPVTVVARPQPDPVPGFVIALAGGNPAEPAGQDIARLERSGVIVPDDLCGYSESRGTIDTGSRAQALHECGTVGTASERKSSERAGQRALSAGPQPAGALPAGPRPAEQLGSGTPGHVPMILWDDAPFEGFLYNWRIAVTLSPGTRIDRFGLETGRYLAPEGTPLAARALPPSSTRGAPTVYEVARPLNVEAGLAAPAFGQPGGGIQYKTSSPVADLIRMGYLKPVG